MSTYTPSLGLEEITPGDQAGLWGNTTNNNLALVDQAITGVTPIDFTGLSGTTYTLTSFDGAVDEARAAVLNVTGIATGQNTIVVPNKQKTYLVRNNTGQNIVFRTASPTASYTVGAGFSILVFCDGNNGVFTGIQSPSTGTLTVAGGGTGATTFTAGFIKSPGGASNLTSAASVALNTGDVSGTLPVTNGGTGATSFTNNALVQFSSGTMTSLVGSATGQVATWNGTTWVASTPSTGVASFSGGVTGLTPATATTGAITLSGTLEITSGGTGATTAAGARTALGIGSVGTINTNGSTTQFLRGDGAFVAPVSSVAAGTGISVSGSTGAVTISNSGVTSISAGSGITVSGSTGGVTISATSTGVTSVTATSPLSSSGGTSPNISISSSPSFAGTVSANSFTGGSLYNNSGNTISLGFSGSPYVSVNTSNIFFPNFDSAISLGSGGNRWSIVYAANGTINTSDANEKQQIRDFSAAEKAVAQILKGKLKAFKFNDAVEKKGENARIHFGIIAQDIKAAFESQGLDPNKYGVFCSDTLADGTVRLGVRYDELFALIIGSL